MPSTLAKTPMSESPPADTGPSRELFRTFLAVNRHLAQETDLDKAMRRLLDAAARALGCAVIPAGVGQTELQVKVAVKLMPCMTRPLQSS